MLRSTESHGMHISSQKMCNVLFRLDCACTLILIEILAPLEAFKNRLFYHILLIAPVNLKYSHAMQAKNEDFECTCS